VTQSKSFDTNTKPSEPLRGFLHLRLELETKMEMKRKCIAVADRPTKLRDSGNVMETCGGKQPFPPPFRNHFQGVWQAIITDFHHPNPSNSPSHEAGV
jgi:hypothetical protein